MVKKLIYSSFLFSLIITFGCEDAQRDWDNPFDPRSNRSLWTPDSLEIVQKSENEIELSISATTGLKPALYIASIVATKV